MMVVVIILSGENSSIWEIADSIYASQTEKATADHHPTYGPSSTWEHSGEGEVRLLTYLLRTLVIS